MKYLVDTHVFLWWMVTPERLSPAAREAIETESAEIAFSTISGWEIAIKSFLGKLKGVPLGDLPAEIAGFGWTELPLRLQHLPVLAELPFYHRDPFDRGLIAQAMAEKLIFITRDERATLYDLPTFW